MKGKSNWLLLLGLGLLISVLSGCGGTSDNPGIDAAGDAKVQTKLMRLVQGDDGSEYICEDPSSYNPGKCVKKGTNEPYLCKIIKDNEKVVYHCIPDKSTEPWTPPCEDYKQFGDHKSGLQCWDPPANYCKDGADTMVTWFCKSDGSKCCLSGGDCFRCGWIDMFGCKVAGESNPTDPSVCEKIKAKLPEPYKSCIEGKCSKQAMDQITNDPECAGPDPSLIICD